MPVCPCGYAHNSESASNCKLCGLPLSGGPAPEARSAAGAAEASGGRQHKLVAEGTEPVALVAGKTFTIGRESDVDMPIPSQRVSRKHAEIVWRAGLPVLRNLSQSAGTLVNGKAVTEHELRDGDKLQIGPWECVYSVRGAGAPLKPEAHAAMGSTIVDAGGSAMSGDLAQMSVFTLLRMLESRDQTGTLTLRAASKEGNIILDKGRITSADVEGQRGKPALFVLLSWREGTYAFSLEKKTTGRIFRTFDYSAVPEQEFGRRTTITDLLEEAEAAGIEEATPGGSAPAPKPAAPRPGAPNVPRPGTVRRPPPGRAGAPSLRRGPPGTR